MTGPGLIYWPAVFVAGGMALAMLTGLVVWLGLRGDESPAAQVIPEQESPQLPAQKPAPVALKDEPTSPAPVQQPTVHPRSHRSSSVHRSLARPRPAPAKGPELPVPEPSPPVPPAAPPAAPAPVAVAPRPVGENYGTSVLFLSNPTEAGRVARSEDKLLFVLHVSGNFEESCFT